MAFRLNMQTINRTSVCVCMNGIRMYGWICLLPLLHFDWYDLLMSQTCFFYHFNFVILGKGTFLNYRWNCITYMLRNAQATSNFHWKYACYFVALLLSFFQFFLFSAAIFLSCFCQFCLCKCHISIWIALHSIFLDVFF